MFMRTDVNILITVTGVLGLLLTITGILYQTYSKLTYLMYTSGQVKESIFSGYIARFIVFLTGLPLIRIVRHSIESGVYSSSESKEEATFKASGITILIVMLSVININILKDVGELWYTKVLVIGISIFLPYYILTLSLDLLKDKVQRQVPTLVDEFRGAFLNHGRIKQALLESAKKTGGRLGKIIEKAALSTDVTVSLNELKTNINNIWFSIFVQLLINFKSNGGELIEQLYKLNKSIVLYNNLEKKKSKRLIWYELFAVFAAIVSIPAVYWFNLKILGEIGYVASDAQSNMTVSRIIGLSILSLVIIRILRRL